MRLELVNNGDVDIPSLKGNAEDIFEVSDGDLILKLRLGEKHPKSWCKPPRAECELGLEIAPSLLHPGGCGDLCAPDRHLNPQLEAAGQALDL